MAEEVHPLKETSKWQYNQPSMRVDASLMSTDLNGEGMVEHQLAADAQCREEVLSGVRGQLQTMFTAKDTPPKGQPWGGQRTVTRKVDLSEHGFENKSQSLEGHISRISIRTTGLDYGGISHELFLRVADTIVGNVCVLLNPGRAPGEWWRTDPETAMTRTGEDQRVMWNGADNFFLFHPVLLALVLGLFRQSSHMCIAGVGERILEDLPYERTEEAMTECDYRLAISNAKALRRWIEVPPATNCGSLRNYAFPKGLWLRFMRLHQAMRKHSAEEIFGGPFEFGWNLIGKNYSWTGAHGFWGLKEDDNGTPQQYNRLLELGRPAKKKENKDGESPKEGAGK